MKTLKQLKQNLVPYLLSDIEQCITEALLSGSTRVHYHIKDSHLAISVKLSVSNRDYVVASTYDKQIDIFLLTIRLD